MSLRCTSSYGAAVLGLSITCALVTGLPVTAARAAAPTVTSSIAPLDASVPRAGSSVGADGSGPAPMLALVHQSAWVTSPSAGMPGTFDLTVGVDPALARRGGLAVDVEIYNRLTARSTLEQDLTSSPSGFLDSTGAVPIPTSFPGGVGDVPIPVAVATNDGESTSSDQYAVDLDCQPGTCSGVYPVSVVLEHDDNRITRFTTFLTYVEPGTTSPLQVSVVLPFTAPVSIGAAVRTGSDAVDADPSLSPGSVGDLRRLAASLSQHPQVPLTVDIDPRTVQALGLDGAAGKAVVKDLSSLSLSSADQFPTQPYVTVDPGALAGSGLGNEVTRQLHYGESVLAAAHIRTRTGTWVNQQGVGTDLAAGLHRLGARRVVVPSGDLDQATEYIDGDAVTWSQPFQLDLGKSSTVNAAVADSGLDGLFTADRGDPVLAANQLLGDLAFIHFEVPGAKARGVVVAAPGQWTPDTGFLDALLAGLTSNPLLEAGTLDHFFTTLAAGSHGAPRVRRPAASGPGPVLTRGLAHRLSLVRRQFNAFAGAVHGATAVVGGLYQLSLDAESTSLSPSGQSAGVATFVRALTGQLSQFTLSNDRTLTLTSRTARIPITILSSAPYNLTAELTLSGDKFEFPQGAVRHDVAIDNATNVVPIQVEGRTTGDLPLFVTLRSPTGTLVIARAQITVRSTATSIVGIVLTLAAAAVLVAWWVRTWRSSRAARRQDAVPAP